MSPDHKPLVWLAQAILTPPLSGEARIEAGYLLRQLQAGTKLTLPRCRPMPSIGRRCSELRITDQDCIWRIFCRVDEDAIVVVHWVKKKTEATAAKDIELCKARLRNYDQIAKEAADGKA